MLHSHITTVGHLKQTTSTGKQSVCRIQDKPRASLTDSVLIGDKYFPDILFNYLTQMLLKNIFQHQQHHSAFYTNTRDSLVLPSPPLWLQVQPTPETSKPQTPKTLWTDRIRCWPHMLGQPPCSSAACGLMGSYFNVCLRDSGTGRMLRSLSSKYLPIIYSFALSGWPPPPSSEDPVVWSSPRLCRSNIKREHTHARTCTLWAVPEVF